MYKRHAMRHLATGLIASLIVVGLWGPDSLVAAQDDCLIQGAVDPGETPLASDCEVLLDNRDTLAGTATLNWAPDTPIEDWEGIAVGGTPARVVGVSLRDRGLTGTMPQQIGDLSYLAELSLRENQLTGTIPAELRELSDLTSLDLSGNELNGPIPSTLGRLSGLTILDLGWNELTGAIPTELGGLTKLRRLDLAKNQLTGTIPSELGNLADLTELSLNDNQLTGQVASGLGSLTDVTRLDLSDNQLTGSIPDNFVSLTSLRSFYFWDNEGLCAPTDSAFQTWLQGIREVGGYPCDFAADRAILVTLYNATDGANWKNNSNWLSGRPMGRWNGVSTDDQGHVIELRLSGNQLTGTIPAGLGNLSNLVYLSLHKNQLSGAIPAQLGDLANLAYLSLYNNQLSGTIPTQLGPHQSGVAVPQ